MNERNGMASSTFDNVAVPDQMRSSLRNRLLLILLLVGGTVALVITLLSLWSLGTVTHQAEALLAATSAQDQLQQSSRELIYNRILPASGLLLILVVITGLLVSRHLVSPIRKLADATKQAAAGEWDTTFPHLAADEIGLLGDAIASLTQQLKSQFENTENQVESRLSDLQRKISRLEIAAEIARDVAAMRELDPLLERGTHLIAARFGFYHVGLFLFDNNREYLVLRASSSEGGNKSIARGHRLKIGEAGIVGDVAGKTRPRLAFDVGQGAVYFRNPDLPLTRSEMAIPLKGQAGIIGVLDIHAVEPSAFTQEDVDILCGLADAVALAIENARLITETRQAVADLNRSTLMHSLQAWSERLRDRPAGFRYTRLGTIPLAPPELIPAEPPGAAILTRGPASQLVVPLLIHGQALGRLSLRRDSPEPAWTDEELHAIQQAVLQIGQALENARLLEEAQIRAAREQTVNVITTQVRSAGGVQAILQNTIRELGKALGVSHTFIQFGKGSQGAQQGSQSTATPATDPPPSATPSSEGS
jgi:GAF domain-containing protein